MFSLIKNLHEQYYTIQCIFTKTYKSGYYNRFMNDNIDAHIQFIEKKYGHNGNSLIE